MRKIIHIDMDAFYAAVEQREHPEYRGKPVVVGGNPERRGVVCTASYEARAFGIRSAMPTATARRLCPHAVFLPPRMGLYASVSREIMAILRQYTDLVEPVSIDEAYLDVTQNKAGLPHASQVARALKRDILQVTHLTASAGVAPNKFIAKIASDLHKPDGLTVIVPKAVHDLLTDLPVRTVPGIGPVTAERMDAVGIRTVGELRSRALQELVALFGKAGRWYHAVARGEDDRPVVTHRVRKSLGAETTFARDLTEAPEMIEALRVLAEEVAQRMAKGDVRGRTLTLKITYADFTRITRSVSLSEPAMETADLLRVARGLLAQTEAGKRPVRLLGITVSSLDALGELPSEENCHSRQLRLPLA